MKRNLKQSGISGITLISLIITIILLIILAGIAIHLALSNKGIIKMAKDSAIEYSRQGAKDKLELVLLDMQIDQIDNKDYNENEYLTNKLKEKGMNVYGNAVVLDGWEFEIDRSIPRIISAGERADNSPIIIEQIQESDSQIAIKLSDRENKTIKQYKLGNATSWTNYTDIIVLDSYQLQKELEITDGKVLLTVKEIDASGNETEAEKMVRFNQMPYKEEDTIIEGESIIACVKNNSLESGNYIFRVIVDKDNNTTQDYPVELYNYNQNANYIANCNTKIGNTNYTGFGNATAEKRMLILKYNQNLTIEENVTLTPTGTKEIINGVTGLCTKKGMFIYCEGTIENKGTITMTAKGTVNQAGENVYLWKNEDESSEFIPAVGGAGGGKVSKGGKNTTGTVAGKNGTNGSLRSTGGGGSGGAKKGDIFNYTVTSGAGTAGTSYSGGSGRR